MKTLFTPGRLSKGGSPAFPCLGLALLGVLFSGACNRQGAGKPDPNIAGHIAMLKSFVAPDVLKSVDPEFYSYPGFRDWWRVPLVYPYSIHTIDSLERGALFRFNGKGRVSSPNESEDQMIFDLTHIAFDRNVLIARVMTGRRDANVPMHWIIFDFASGKDRAFSSESQALAAAQAQGFTGPAVLSSLQAEYEKCFGK